MENLNRLKLRSIVLLLFMAAIANAKTSLTIIPLNSAEQQYELAKIGKITFDQGVIYLYDFNNVLLGAENTKQIGKIVFVEGEEQGMEEIGGQARIVADVESKRLIITGLSDRQIVRVYDTMGRFLMMEQAQAEQTIVDVSVLPCGTYLLQLGVQVIKFVKQ